MKLTRCGFAVVQVSWGELRMPSKTLSRDFYPSDWQMLWKQKTRTPCRCDCRRFAVDNGTSRHSVKGNPKSKRIELAYIYGSMNTSVLKHLCRKSSKVASYRQSFTSAELEAAENVW